MEKIINILKTEYGINCLSVIPQKGGNYRCQDSNANYMVKGSDVAGIAALISRKIKVKVAYSKQ